MVGWLAVTNALGLPITAPSIGSGELEAALIGGKWLVREEAVDAWFRSRCTSPNPFSQSPRARTPRAGSRRSDATASVE
jgi:hypothetical protein